MSAPITDEWSSGSNYDNYIGRWSRLIARAFLAWLNVPVGGRWLDVGCGTGVLTRSILELANPQQVIGVDQSAAYVEFARTQTEDSRASFEVGDAQQLRFDADRFDAAVSGLVLNFVSRPDRAVAEMVRVVRPSGIVAAYVWDYAEGMQVIRSFWDAACALDPAAWDLDEARRFPLARSEPLRELFHVSGLRDIDVHAIEVPTVFRDFDDLWRPFTGGQGPAPGYVQTLTTSQREDLQNLLRARLPIASDGSILLRARAWAVQARRRL